MFHVKHFANIYSLTSIKSGLETYFANSEILPNNFVASKTQFKHLGFPICLQGA